MDIVGREEATGINRRGEGRRGKEREGLPPPCNEGTKKEPSPVWGVCACACVCTRAPNRKAG